MFRWHLLLASAGTVIACAALSLPGSASAQAHSAEVITTCVAEGVAVEVELTLSDEPFGAAVGYIVRRHTHGVCEPPVTLTDAPIAFDVDASLMDTAADPDRLYSYAMVPVDADGERVPGLFWTFPAAANCAGGPVMRGTVTDLIWPLAIDGCPDQCWPLGFLEGEAVQELQQFVGTDQVVEIHGTLEFYFEGPFVLVSGWGLSDCDPVAARRTDWSSLKALYAD
jgi:hypothetical protein